MTKITTTKKCSLKESLEFQLRYLLPNLNNNHITYCYYIYMFPNNYAEQLLKDGISVSDNSVRTNVQLLKDSNILVRIPIEGKRKTNIVLNPIISKNLIKESYQLTVKIELNEKN